MYLLIIRDAQKGKFLNESGKKTNTEHGFHFSNNFANFNHNCQVKFSEFPFYYI